MRPKGTTKTTTREKVDKETNAVYMFLSISLMFVVVSVIWTYTPDKAMHDWATREVQYLPTGARPDYRTFCGSRYLALLPDMTIAG